jgi:hypothetical protein
MVVVVAAQVLQCLEAIVSRKPLIPSHIAQLRVRKLAGVVHQLCVTNLFGLTRGSIPHLCTFFQSNHTGMWW